MGDDGRSDLVDVDIETDGIERTDDPEQDDEGTAQADRLHRAAIEFGLDADQADLLEVLTDAVEPVADDSSAAVMDRGRVLAGLDDPDVAEAAWLRWGDTDRLGTPLDPLVAALADGHDDDHRGATWLRARQRAWHADTDGAIELLESARDLGHRLVLADLAAIEADRSNPLAAQRLLVEAGIDVNIDLGTEFDPRTAESGFAAELAEEVAPFAAIRPRPMAGRNERCPCGSGKKYKQWEFRAAIIKSGVEIPATKVKSCPTRAERQIDARFNKMIATIIRKHGNFNPLQIIPFNDAIPSLTNKPKCIDLS